ncbi:MAG: GNAT family N-acetyltransferase [Telmatospirillum sp.]|nr:GNAT family N-acetyltransferase [Telmatospirillum sp.]
MTARAADGPRFAEFVTATGTVIGMIVLGTWKNDPSVGYVNHYYLVPAWRGRGLGGRLDDRAVETLRHAGYHRLRLSTMPANAAATALYRRHGWVEAGPREGGEGAVYFERVLDPGPSGDRATVAPVQW